MALASVLQQTHPPTEVIVVDDASPAGDAVTLRDLPKHVRVLRADRNRGPGNARQMGTGVATSEYLSYLDSDDLWPANFLECCLARLTTDADVEAVYTGVAKLYPDGRVIEYTEKPSWLDVREAIVRFHAYPAIGMCFRRCVLTEIGGWDRQRKAIEDWDLVVRLLDRFGPIPLIPGTLSSYRVGHQQGRRNSRGFDTLRRWRHTSHRNHVLLEKHFGRGASRKRLAQAIDDRGYRMGGVQGHLLRLVAGTIGPPLHLAYPVESIT